MHCGRDLMCGPLRKRILPPCSAFSFSVLAQSAWVKRYECRAVFPVARSRIFTVQTPSVSFGAGVMRISSWPLAAP